MLDTSTSYKAIRSTAGVYEKRTEILKLSGLHRGRLLSWLLAKQTEFTEPGTAVESLVLDDDGAVVSAALVVMDDESILVICDEAVGLQQVAEQAINSLELAETFVHQSPEMSHAIAVEGPLSWKVVDGIAGEDISEILLNEWRTGAVDGDQCLLIRIGTTAEYGYVVLTSAASKASVMQRLTERALEIGGGQIDPLVLRRAQAEVNHPILPRQADGLSIFEAGIQWMATPNRTDDYRGSAGVSLTAPTRRIVAAFTDLEDFPDEGEIVTDSGTPVGIVQISTSRAGLETGFGLLLLDVPYCVPGLTLTVGGQTVKTISRPAVDPLSWTQQIGA